MKKLILILTLALLAAGASAQTYVRTNLMVAHTNLASAANTQGSTNFVDASRYGEVAFELTVQGDSTNTGNFSVAFVRSADGTNYESKPFALLTVVGNSNVLVRALTNFDLGALGYVRASYTTNAEGSAAFTNIYLYGYLKGYRRD